MLNAISALYKITKFLIRELYYIFLACIIGLVSGTILLGSVYLLIKLQNYLS